MESLAYIHIALEYEKSLQTSCNSEQLVCPTQTNKTLFAFPNWLSLKFFGWLQPKHSKKVVNH